MLPTVGESQRGKRAPLTHGIHPYAAKFSHVLPRAILEEFSARGQTVLDPFVGSGTTLVEACVRGLSAVGVDSRPSVSNDNPYSEAPFRTTKYRPQFPRRPFASLEQARQWMTWFVTWYNAAHRHSAIKFVTPEQRHTGRDVAILKRRHRLYEAAKARNPNRWTRQTRDWSHPPTVALNPNKTISQLAFEVA